MRATARALLVVFVAAGPGCGTGEITMDSVSSAGLDGGGGIAFAENAIDGLIGPIAALVAS